MRRKLICVLTFLFIIPLFACAVPESNTFRDKLDEIESISIVEVGEFDHENSLYFEIPLATVSELEEFAEKLAKLPYKYMFGDPVELVTGDVVIKIVYDNGDFDFIAWNAQRKYQFSESGVQAHYGFTLFDKAGFDALMDQYLPD